MEFSTRLGTAAITGFAAAVALAAALILSGAAPAAAQEDPSAFIQSLNDQTISVIVSPETSAGQRKDRFGSLLVDNFDLDAIARFAMGRYWRTASEAQRSEYLRLFRAGIVETYATRFESAREAAAREGRPPVGKVVKVQSVATRDKLVHTLVYLEPGKSLRVAYRLRTRNGHWKIIDVVEEGISLLITRRSEVSTVVARQGIDGLLAAMREQTATQPVFQQARANVR